MSKSMKALVLAGVLSIAAASAAQAGGKVTGGDFHANAVPAGGTARSGQIPTLWRRVLAGGRIVGSDFHASAAPACGDQCPVLATDGPPGGIGDNNGRSSGRVATDGPGNPTDGTGRSMASATARSGQIPALWCPVLAGGRVTGSDFHANAAPACDTGRCPVLAGDGGPTGVGGGNGHGDKMAGDGGPGGISGGNGRSAALVTGNGEISVATDGPGGIGDGTGRSAALITDNGGGFRVAGGGVRTGDISF